MLWCLDKMKVNNLIKGIPKWKKVLVCTCEGKIDLCNHCKYTKAEQSIPSKDFKVSNDVMDKNGKVTKKQTRIVKQITILYGSRQDVQGWIF